MSDKLAGGIKAGGTSVSLPVELRQSANSLALTGKVYTDVTASYWRQGGTRTAITTATLTGPSAAYSSGGFVEVDATNMPGLYRFDVPDAAFAAGADWVVISLKVSTAFQVNFMFALESSGAAEVMTRIGAAGAGLTALGDTRIANLDATVSSRSTYAGADTSGTTTLLSRLTSTRAGLLDNLSNLDALVSGVAAAVWSVATRTLTAISDSSGITTLLARLTSGRAVNLDYLDATVSSRSTFAGGAVASVTADVGITQSAADKVWGSTTRTLSSYGTLVADVATAVWAATTRTLSAIADSSGVTTLLARLTSTRAGLLDNLDAPVSSRNATAPDNASVAAILTRTDVATSTRSSHSAADVWAVTTRSLTTFGTLVADMASAVWAATTRTLSSFGFTVSTNANATETAIRAKTDNLPASPAATGAAMTLTSGERDAVAVSVESHLLDEGDSQMLINAIVGAIGNQNVDQAAFVAAVRADLERSGGDLDTLLGRIASALTITGGKVDVNDKTGFALVSAYNAAKTALQSGGSVIASNMRGTDNALLASGYTAPDNADITSALADLVLLLARNDPTTGLAALMTVAAAIKSKTDSLPADPASEGDIPTASDVADAVWEEAAIDHNSAGTMGVELNVAGNSSDPWATVLPGTYTGGQAGSIIGRFDIDPPESPLVVVPGAPADLSLCRVYGYFEGLDNLPTGGLKITFSLTGASPMKSERLVDTQKIVATIIAGQLTNAVGDPWQDLQRNDQLTPAGTRYLVTCPELRLREALITLADDLFDLSSIVT